MIITLEPKQILLTCPPQTVLCELAFGIDTAMRWLFSRSITAFEITRQRDGRNHFVALRSLVEPKTLQFSIASSLGNLVKNNLWPETIDQKDVWSLSNSKCFNSGQYKLASNGHCTLFQIQQLDPDLPLSKLICGNADWFLSMFWLGVKSIKHQSSLQVTQVLVDRTFTEAEMKSLVYDNAAYPTNNVIGTLR